MKAVNNDLANYLELSLPFEDTSQANAALEAFYEELGQLRKKHRLPDVHVIVLMNIDHGGHLGNALSSAHFGNSAEAAGMCAWSYGKERAQQQAHLEKLMGGEQTWTP